MRLSERAWEQGSRRVWEQRSGIEAQGEPRSIMFTYNDCGDHTLINYSFNALRAVMYSMYSNIHTNKAPHVCTIIVDKNKEDVNKRRMG